MRVTHAARSLSVVVVTKDRPEALMNLINSVLRCRRIGELIIIDGSKKRAKEKWSDIRVRNFHLPKAGMEKARNFGIKIARHEIIAFLDDDSIVDPKWSEHLLQTYEKYPNAAGVGGRVISGGEHASNLPPLIYFGSNGGSVTLWGRVRFNYATSEKAVETQLLPGCNMSFRKSVLEDVGGFDERYKGTCYREETDLQIRITRLGYKLYYQPKAVVTHLRLSKSIKIWETFASLFVNHTYFWVKNFVSAQPWLFLLLPVFLLDFFIVHLLKLAFGLQRLGN